MASNLTARQKAQFDDLSMSEKIAILLLQMGGYVAGVQCVFYVYIRILCEFGWEMNCYSGLILWR